MVIDKSFGSVSVHCLFSEERLQDVMGKTFLGWPVRIHDRIEGAFVRLTETPDALQFENDLFGLYRLYYWQGNDQIFITDDTDLLLRTEDYRSLDEIPEEKELFAKSLGYTSGDATIYRKIKKLPPASRLTIDANGLQMEMLYPFRQIERIPDKERHIQIVRQEVENMLFFLKDRPEKIILFYSGGSDSLYLAKILIAQKIAFHPVFMYDIANPAMSDAAWREATGNAAKLAMPEIELLKIDSRETSLDEVIARCLRFDRHKARMHFLAMAQITQKYGKEIIVVNGQNSDAIFSYGPSEKNCQSLAKRYLMYGKCRFLKFLLANFCSFYCRREMRFPRDEKESFFSIATNHRYLKLYDLSYSQSTRSYLGQKLVALIGRLGINRNCAEMFLKIFFYIQGPDSQVVVQSAKHFQIAALLMPFATSETVRATLSYKDDHYELFHPKYCIRIVNKQ